MTAIILMLLAQASLPAEALDGDWVVRDVIPGGPSPYSGFERRLYRVKAQGDLDRDGRCDFLLQYSDGSLTGGYPWDGLLSVREGGNIVEEVQRNRWDLGFHYGFWLSDAALLDSPLGTLRVLSSDPGFLFRTYKKNGSIVATSTRSYEITYWVPDLDGDGYDDLFTQVEVNGIWARSARVDGRTMSELWSDVRGDATGECVLSPNGTSLFSDFDHDGTIDFLSVFPIWLGGPIEAQIYALSGVDGHLIWNRNEPGAGAIIAASIVPDLTGDTVAEVAFAVIGPWFFSSPRFMMLDGASGAVLWSLNTSSLAVSPPIPGFTMRSLEFPIFITDSPTHPGEFQVVLHAEFEDPNPGGLETSRFLHADARSGRILGWAKEPTNLEPWYPDTFDIYMQPRYVLGDVDRDGLTEVGILSNGLSVDIPGNVFTPWHLAIVGQRTLFQPSSARPGQQLDYTITIPGAPDHNYFLLLSLGFDRDGGERVDGWKTHLVADAAYATTLAGRYPGRLDARGVGQQSVRLPLNPSLSGKTLYAKAVVWKPGSTSEVWTMSSLGITEIR